MVVNPLPGAHRVLLRSSLWTDFDSQGLKLGRSWYTAADTAGHWCAVWHCLLCIEVPEGCWTWRRFLAVSQTRLLQRGHDQERCSRCLLLVGQTRGRAPTSWGWFVQRNRTRSPHPNGERALLYKKNNFRKDLTRSWHIHQSVSSVLTQRTEKRRKGLRGLQAFPWTGRKGRKRGRKEGKEGKGRERRKGREGKGRKGRKKVRELTLPPSGTPQTAPEIGSERGPQWGRHLVDILGLRGDVLQLLLVDIWSQTNWEHFNAAVLNGPGGSWKAWVIFLSAHSQHNKILWAKQ